MANRDSMLRCVAVAAMIVLTAVMAVGCRRHDGSSTAAPPSQATAAATSAAGSVGSPAAGASAQSTGTAAGPLRTANSALRVKGTPGCALPLPAGLEAGKTTVREIDAGGTRRSYRLHVPVSYERGRAMPLVLNFHGRGSNAREQEAYSGFVPLSESEGFVLVTPDALGDPQQWSATVLQKTPDDIAFTRTLLDSIEGELCIDANRVFSAGISSGAAMSSYAGCLLGDRIAAIGPVAAVYYPRQGCKGKPAVLAFHGTDDKVVPFDGGVGLAGVLYGGAKPGAQGWAEANGCGPAPAETRLSEHVTELNWTGCRSDVHLVVIKGGGHTWPGAIPVPVLGPTTSEVSAAKMLWQFFSSHPLE